MGFQHTAARRRLPHIMFCLLFSPVVSTHSRPKAAAIGAICFFWFIKCFNTQPPEGGCLLRVFDAIQKLPVSTHSRPKAAAAGRMTTHQRARVFQHTAARRRLPGMVQVPSLVLWFQHTAARRRLRPIRGLCCLYGCFNTQPPEGGCEPGPIGFADKPVSTHSRPKAAAPAFACGLVPWAVSTHSRPKAAACSRTWANIWISGFNTQPPEGGCRQR